MADRPRGGRSSLAPAKGPETPRHPSGRIRAPRTGEVRRVIGFFSKIKVECYAGYRGDEEPRRFTWGGKTLGVVEVLDRWLDPNHRYFKVRADDDAVYLLRHDAGSGEWELRPPR